MIGVSMFRTQTAASILREYNLDVNGTSIVDELYVTKDTFHHKTSLYYKYLEVHNIVEKEVRRGSTIYRTAMMFVLKYFRTLDTPEQNVRNLDIEAIAKTSVYFAKLLHGIYTPLPEEYSKPFANFVTDLLKRSNLYQKIIQTKNDYGNILYTKVIRNFPDDELVAYRIQYILSKNLCKLKKITKRANKASTMVFAFILYVLKRERVSYDAYKIFKVVYDREPRGRNSLRLSYLKNVVRAYKDVFEIIIQEMPGDEYEMLVESLKILFEKKKN